MNAIDIDHQRKSDDSCTSDENSHESDKKYEKYGESNEENYEAYRTKNLPEGYTPYKGSDQAVEVVYDRYDSDYEPEQPGQEAKPTSCCKKGWFSNLDSKSWKIETVIHRLD